MPLIEAISLKLDQLPWGGIVRTILGLVLIPSYAFVSQGRFPAWGLLPFFLLVLVALRIAPLVFRKVLPFSEDAKSIWAARRRLAKFYDSYQWQKLFWIGLGFALYLVWVKETDAYKNALVAVCVLGGAVGLWTWRRISRNLPTNAKLEGRESALSQ